MMLKIISQKSTKTMVFIHGMFGQGEDWYWGNYRRFFEAEGYSISSPTLPLHHFPNNELTNPEFRRLARLGIADYRQVLEQHIDSLPVPPVLMGHSMGGLLSMLIASHRNVKTGPLVLLTPASPYGIVALQPSVIKTFAPHMLAFWRYHLPIKLSPEKAIYSMYHLVDKDTQDRILSHLVYESSLAARELGYHALHWWNRPTELNPSSFLETPSLLVSGEMDRITPPRINYQTAGLIHANVLGLKNHAHGILWEPGWDVICQKILLWLRSLNS